MKTILSSMAYKNFIEKSYHKLGVFENYFWNTDYTNN
jgi:hypothetical protein